MRQLHADGFGRNEIARQLGCSPATVTNWAQRLELSFRPGLHDHPNQPLDAPRPRKAASRFYGLPRTQTATQPGGIRQRACRVLRERLP
ncbi:helix-turn-helix domain-containing protein [Streptomyces purpurascens]